MEILDIYQENGEKTDRTIQRGETIKAGDYILVVHIWITNNRGDYLIQKRAHHLKYYPGIWAMTGGAVRKGESSQEAALREVEEELGFKAEKNKMGKITRMKRGHMLTDIWSLHQSISLDSLKIQKEEVSQVKWVSRCTLEEMISGSIFFDYGSEYLMYIFPERKQY